MNGDVNRWMGERKDGDMNWSMDGWMDGWMETWINQWMDNGWMEMLIDGWVKGRMETWIDQWMDGWMETWINQWMDNGWMEMLIDRWVKGRMDTFIDQWMDGWMETWINQWMDADMNYSFSRLLTHYNGLIWPNFPNHSYSSQNKDTFLKTFNTFHLFEHTFQFAKCFLKNSNYAIILHKINHVLIQITQYN